MGDRDDLLRPFPGGGPLQVYHAVLCRQVVEGGARVTSDGAVGRGGDGAVLELSVLDHHGGGQSNKALSALVQVGTQNEI